MNSQPDISVAIPFIRSYDLTSKCLEYLHKNSTKRVEVILLDNGSFVLGGKNEWPKLPSFWGSNMIVYPENVGVFPTLLKSIEIANTPYLLHMHNDVLIHEKGWDERIIKAFEDDPQLGMVGFFGAPGVGPDGARLAPHGNMLGREWGTPGNLHGGILQDMFPSCVFDSLAMCFRVDAFKKLPIPDNMPPHHWYDRIITLLMIESGWRAATIGIAFDHHGGGSSTNLLTFSEDWCAKNGVDPGQNADLAMYLYGKSIFDTLFGWRLPLRVDEQYNYTWSN